MYLHLAFLIKTCKKMIDIGKGLLIWYKSRVLGFGGDFLNTGGLKSSQSHQAP